MDKAPLSRWLFLSGVVLLLALGAGWAVWPSGGSSDPSDVEPAGTRADLAPSSAEPVSPRTASGAASGVGREGASAPGASSPAGEPSPAATPSPSSKPSDPDGASPEPGPPAVSPEPAAPPPPAAAPAEDRSTEASGASEAQYVGPDACKKCHLKEWKSWKGTRMAAALKALFPGAAEAKKTAAGLDLRTDYSQDPACVRCHTTGYGSPSGYPKVPRPAAGWSEEGVERADLLGGVGCEACHGPGSLYPAFKKEHLQFTWDQIRPLGATVPVREAQCATCHARECPTMPPDYVFDYEKAVQDRKDHQIHEHVPLKLDHGGPAPR